MKSDWLYDVLDFFWPHFRKEPKDKQEDAEQPDYSYVSDWKCRHEMLKAVYAKEEDRLKTVESKSSLMIGTMSVVTSIIIALISFITKANIGISRWYIVIVVIISVALIMYLLCTLWHAVQAQRRATYHTIGVSEILECNYVNYERLCKAYIAAIKINQETINKKVNSMVLAQENFKRAIIVLGLYVLLFFCISITSDKETKTEQKYSTSKIEMHIDCNIYRDNSEVSPEEPKANTSSISQKAEEVAIEQGEDEGLELLNK